MVVSLTTKHNMYTQFAEENFFILGVKMHQFTCSEIAQNFTLSSNSNAPGSKLNDLLPGTSSGQ